MMEERRIAAVPESDLSSMHAILVLCAEHMHRAQGMSHWYPYRDFASWASRVDPARVYGVYSGPYLIGTFNLTETPRPYQQEITWADPQAKAVYFGGLGVLPYFQGGGTGRWIMAQADQMARDAGYAAIRFDGVASNAPLMKFYDRLSYTRRGVCDLTAQGWQPVMCYERVF
jgi:GNAT superfamily N-acetyltransferase